MLSAVRCTTFGPGENTGKSDSPRITYFYSRLILVAIAASLLAAGAVAQDAKPPVRVHSITGNVQSLPVFHSKALGNDRNIAVYLPPGYDKQPKRRYPVVYMADGQNVFDGFTSYIPNQEWKADEAAESLILANAIEPIIIVAIDNAGVERANEYLPTRDVRAMAGGKAGLFEKMLIEEIKPMIDHSFRTKREPRNTAFVGSSYGGVLALDLGLEHPDVFGKLGVVSPSLNWDDQVMLKKISALKGKADQQYWIDMGTNEWGPMVGLAQQAAVNFERKGWKQGKDLLLYIDGNAIHNEGAWARRFPLMLVYFFANRGVF